MPYRPNSIVFHEYGTPEKDKHGNPFRLSKDVTHQPYHALVYPDGTVRYRYPEDPWGRPAPHAYKFNPQSVGISYAGPVGAKPTPEAMATLKRVTGEAEAHIKGLGVEKVGYYGHGEAYSKTKGTGSQASKHGRSDIEGMWYRDIVGGTTEVAYSAQGEKMPGPGGTQGPAGPTPPAPKEAKRPQELIYTPPVPSETKPKGDPSTVQGPGMPTAWEAAKQNRPTPVDIFTPEPLTQEQITGLTSSPSVTEPGSVSYEAPEDLTAGVPEATPRSFGEVTYGTQPEVNMAPSSPAGNLGDVPPPPELLEPQELPKDQVVLPYEKFTGKERALRQRAFTEKYYKGKGYTEDDIRTIEARAQFFEKQREIGAPVPIQTNLPVFTAQEALDFRAEQAPFSKKVSEPTWNEVLYADFVQRNSLLNTAEEAVVSWFSQARSTVDPDFQVPPEALKQFPEMYHEYLLQANNSEDYLFREYEIKSRMQGEAIAQQAWDTDWTKGLASYVVSTAPHLLYGFAGAFGAGFAASRLVGAGASFGARFAALGVAEAGVFAPEMYYGRKGGIYTDADVALGLGLGALGSAWGARYLRNRRAEARQLELAARIAEAHAPPAPVAPPPKHYDFRNLNKDHKSWVQHMETLKAAREADELLARQPPRPIVNEDLSIEVPRAREGAKEAAENFEADRDILSKWPAFLESGRRVASEVRKMVDEAFERQAHVADGPRSGFIAMPANYKGSIESFVRKLMREGRPIVLRRYASQVGGEKSRVVKIHVPKNSPLIDMGVYAGMDGAYMIRPSNLAPKTTGKGKGFSTNLRTLKNEDGTDVEFRDGTKAKYYQVDAVLEVPPVKGATKQWMRLVTNDGVADPEVIGQTNAKKALDPDIEYKGKAEDLPDELFDTDDALTPPKDGGSAATDAPVVRERLVNTTESVEKIMQEQQAFRQDTVPFAARIPVLKELLSTGLRNMQDGNFLFRDMFKGFVERGFNHTAKELGQGLGTTRTIDRVAVEIISTTDGKIMKSAVDNFNKYAKAVGGRNFMKANLAQDELIRRFGKAVNDYRRHVERHGVPPQDVPPGVAEHNAILEKVYSDFLDYANDPGKWVGEPRVTETRTRTLEDGTTENYEEIVSGYPPLAGFDDEAVAQMKRAGWSPRIWIGDYITHLENKTGNPLILNEWLRGSLKHGILKDEKFLTWAKGRAGIEKDKPMSLWTADDAARLQDEIDLHATKIGDAMADTIKRAKAGWSPEIDLINGNGDARKLIDAIRLQLKERNKDIPDELADILNNILWKRDTKDGKSGRHSFRRAILNTDHKLKYGDYTVTLDDFVSTDATQNARGYVRRMGGRIAWGSYSYTSPGGGYKVRGISSDEDFRKFVKHPIMEVETNLGRTSSKFWPEGRKTEVEQQLDALWEYTTGNTPVGTAGLQALQNYSYMAHLGNAGFAQAVELSNQIAYTGLKGVATTDAWKDLYKRLRYGKPSQEELTALGQILEDEMGLGTDIVRGSLGMQADERMGLGAGGKVGTFFDRGARFVFISSGLAPLQQELQRSMARGLFNKFATHVDNAKSFSGLARRHQHEFIEIAGDRQMAERIFNVFKKNAKMEKRQWGGTKVLDFDEAGIDAAAYYQLKHGIKRLTEQGIQTNSYGTQHRWMNYPLVRAFLTLKSFLYGSVTKQLIRHGREIATYSAQAGRDARAGNFGLQNGMMDSFLAMAPSVASLSLQVAAGAGLYALMQESKMLFLSEDEKEERRQEIWKMENLAKAGLIRSGSLGLIPTIWNTPMQYAAPELTLGLEGYKGSGLDADITSLPAASQLKRALKLGGQAGSWALNGFEGELTQKDLNQTQKLLSNQMQLQWMVNVIGSQLLELEPE